VNEPFSGATGDALVASANVLPVGIER